MGGFGYGKVMENLERVKMYKKKKKKNKGKVLPK